MSNTEKRYSVATHTKACAAFVRTTLRRALASQYRDNVWHGTEYVNTARTLAGNVGAPPSAFLPDEPVWELTKHELATIHRALEWRQSRPSYKNYAPELRAEWSRISDEITRVLRDIWHSEGRYWL